MLRLDELVVLADGKALRIVDGLLEFGGQFVETHNNPFEIIGYDLDWGNRCDFKSIPQSGMESFFTLNSDLKKPPLFQLWFILQKTAFLTVLLWATAVFCPPLFAAPSALQLPDGTEVELRAFPAQGDTLMLWLACDEGHGAWEPKAAQTLAAAGIEVWLSDMLGAHFLPLARAASNRFPARKLPR